MTGPERWMNERLIRRSGPRPSCSPPLKYIPTAEDIPHDSTPIATWTAHCDAEDCPASPRRMIARVAVYQHLDWPDKVAASVQTHNLCRHHADEQLPELEAGGWFEVATRPLD